MAEIKLFGAPGSCSRVPTIVLEEAGVEFESHLVRFMKGEHKSPEYKNLNPKGKVPTLVIDGKSLTENVAIITYLNKRFPKATLMPETLDSMQAAYQLADLSFCAATLHPIVTRIRMPQLFANEAAAKTVWEKGCEGMHEYFALIDHQLKGGAWWYGENWSALDAYLYWVFWRVEGSNYPVSTYKHFQAHKERMELRPAVQKALAREKQAQAQLKSEGLLFIPPNIL